MWDLMFEWDLMLNMSSWNSFTNRNEATVDEGDLVDQCLFILVQTVLVEPLGLRASQIHCVVLPDQEGSHDVRLHLLQPLLLLQSLTLLRGQKKVRWSVQYTAEFWHLRWRSWHNGFLIGNNHFHEAWFGFLYLCYHFLSPSAGLGGACCRPWWVVKLNMFLFLPPALHNGLRLLTQKWWKKY